MCLRLSSREKKKNRNSPSRKTVGDKEAPPRTSHHSRASPTERGKALAAGRTCSGQGPWEYGCLHLSNAAAEWQARNPRRRSRELKVACPLEGLVRQPSSRRQQP
jgi:hypothetical protein